jgi:hypothetical protein
MEQLHIEITVRDDWGHLIKDKDGVKRISFNYDIEDRGEDNVFHNLKHTARTLAAWMPERLIEITCSFHDTIGGTYPVLYSLEIHLGKIKEIKKH